jgi:hypothetical protein
MSQQELLALPGVTEWTQPIKTLMFVLVLLGILSLLACMLVQHSGWRRFYLVLAILDALLVFGCIHKMSVLSPWQKLEIFSVVIGAGLLVVGLVGWYRENERQNDLVSFCLVIGSLLTTAPLLPAAIIHRSGPRPYISWPDEMGLVLAGVVLLGTGIVGRLKANTLIGSSALGALVLVNIIGLYRFLNEAWIVGVSFTVGGGLLFGAGLFLSMYRDRLLLLPEKIKRREGIFKVLSWR